jgi:hypothetical protein
MKTAHPESKMARGRSVIAHTTDGREITINTQLLQADHNAPWVMNARIEDHRG